MAGVVEKKEKNQASQSVLDFFVNLFLFFAVFSAFAAIVFAYLWLATSWYTPYENYKETIFVSDQKGYSFRIEYPKRILANGKQAVLTVTLRGIIDATKSIDIEIPHELRPVELSDSVELPGEVHTLKYKDSAANRIVQPNFVIVNTKVPQTVKLIFINSKTVQEIGWYSTKTVRISSADLLSNDILVYIQMETISGARIREFVNSSVGDKSPFILLVSGLISWAVSYLLQYIKERREQDKERRQEIREKLELAKKNNEELWNGLKSGSVSTIERFASQVKAEGYSEEFQNSFRVLILNDWKNTLVNQIIISWEGGAKDGAAQLIEVLIFLEEKFSSGIQPDSASLRIVHDLLFRDERILQPDDINNILDAYGHWRRRIQPVLQKIIKKDIENSANWIALATIFERRKELAYTLLRTLEIRNLIYGLVTVLNERKNREEILAIEKEQMEALEKIRVGSASLNWHSLWQKKQKTITAKLQLWLRQYDANTKYPPFGAEFAEFDVHLDYFKVPHPVINKIGHPTSSIIFGALGSGKTATAFLLVEKCRTKDLGGTSPETGAFPIYSIYNDSVDGESWLLLSVAKALINFIADNPERFLMANISRKFAMGKLMLIYTLGIKNLRNVFRKTIVGGIDDQEEVLSQLVDIEIDRKKKYARHEILELLQGAIPEGFDRIYFLMDISQRYPLKQVAEIIEAFSDLSLMLAKQDFFFKIFAPIEVKSELVDISMFEQFELYWDDNLLHELLERRFDRFTTYCDRQVKDPAGMLIKASRKSPRKLIYYGNSLMKYAEEKLGELDKLPPEAFSDIISAGNL